MKINTKITLLGGLQLDDIGRLLRDSSPNRDGVGLTIELSESEHAAFGRVFQSEVAAGMTTLIKKAVNGNLPKGFQSDYTDHVFRTFVA